MGQGRGRGRFMRGEGWGAAAGYYRLLLVQGMRSIGRAGEGCANAEATVVRVEAA